MLGGNSDLSSTLGGEGTASRTDKADIQACANANTHTHTNTRTHKDTFRPVETGGTLACCGLRVPNTAA